MSLSVVIDEISEQERKPYTDREKYEYMVKKNNSLELLKNELGLDIDF